MEEKEALLEKERKLQKSMQQDVSDCNACVLYDFMWYHLVLTA